MTVIGDDIPRSGPQRSTLLRLGKGVMRRREEGTDRVSVGVEAITFTEGYPDDVQGKGGVVRPSNNKNISMSPASLRIELSVGEYETTVTYARRTGSLTGKAKYWFVGYSPLPKRPNQCFGWHHRRDRARLRN